MNSEPFTIRVHLEKIPGKGEDAKAVLQLYQDGSGVISVCDGLGGAGSTLYEDHTGASHTGAYYAARLVNQVIDEYFTQYTGMSEERNIETMVSGLQERLRHTVRDKAAALETSPSKLRSSLIKRLPTTMATLSFWPQPADATQYQCCAMWAGDSRGYVLDHAHGLQQLTRDDLKSAGDALDNLLEDSPMSNYINADSPFTVHHHVLTVPLPCVFLVATDGCFGYLPTPMHFEYMLLQNLMLAYDAPDWKRRLGANLQRIAADDVSLALVAIGWQDFPALQEDFKGRCQELKDRYIAPFEDIDSKWHKSVQAKDDCTRQREELRKALWNEYKQKYMRRQEAAARPGSGKEDTRHEKR